MTNENKDFNIKISDLIQELYKLADENNLRFDYFTNSRNLKVVFNGVHYTIIYTKIKRATIHEIVSTIKYSLHHNYRLIKFY